MKKNYAEMSTEDLKKSIKTTGFVTGLLTGALLVSVFINIFLNNKNAWRALIVPLALSPIVIINFNNF
jgi:multisubunit Na+/H+ antiporter MnhE subunit